MQNKTKNQFKIAFLLLTISGAALILQMRKAVADQSISEINQSGGADSKTQDKIDELEKKAAVYREIIEIKKKQSASLSNQLDLMDSDIKQVEVEIEANKRKLEDLNSQVIRLQNQIDEKTKQINDQKVTLSALVQAYYEYSQQNAFNIMFSRETIAEVLMRKDKFSQTGEKINDLLNSIRSEKQALQDKINDLEKNKAKVVETSYTLDSQNSDLSVAKKSKQSLLDQTQGEEARYSQLLQRVEQQKKELLDIDEFYATSGLSVKDFPAPGVDAFDSENWFYYQWDKRWGDNYIGATNSTLKKYGCAVSSVAMALTKLGQTINPGQLAKQPIFSRDLINWSMPDSKFTLASYGQSHGNIDWKIIDAQIAKGKPVIVYVGKTGGSGGHYVVIHHKEKKTGKYVVHDPYFGPNIYLDTTRALVGAMGGKTSTFMDQMIIYN